MEMIKIPHTDLEVSRLAMGCMGLGGGWGSGTQLTTDHERQAREFLDAAEEIGANFFDHANIYGRGRSEEVFGRVLKERPSLRDKIVIQSKCGIRLADDPPGTPQRYDFSREHILESVDAILGRLGTDRLDILLLHRPDPLWEGEEIAEAFRKLHLSGEGPLLRSFEPKPVPNGIPPILFARSPRGEYGGDEPVAPRLCRGRHLIQPKLTPVPQWLGGNDGILPAEGRFAAGLESPGSGHLDGEARRSTRERERNRPLGAEVRRTPRSHCRGRPAGLASQTPSKDPARIGNFTSRSIAGLRQGGFGFFKPRRMVLPLCRSPGRGYALKFAVTAPSRVEALVRRARLRSNSCISALHLVGDHRLAPANEDDCSSK